VQRPNPAASPLYGGTTNRLTRAELWVLDWLRSAGYSADVYSDADFHDGIPNLAAYKALILNTHPEYWTAGMRARLEQYLAGGGRLIYLAGNGLFEEVTYPATPAGAIGFFPGGPGRELSYFRNPRPGVRSALPERQVLGVAYLAESSASAPFTVEQASHRFFISTDLTNGQNFGAEGLNGAASGWEMDTSAPGVIPPDDTTIVTGDLGSDRGNPPQGLVRLARGANNGYAADMTYYDHPGGGFVFAAGAIPVGGSLVVDAALQQIVRNVLDECLVAPAIR
jgi:hypothetical protein